MFYKHEHFVSWRSHLKVGFNWQIGFREDINSNIHVPGVGGDNPLRSNVL